MENKQELYGNMNIKELHKCSVTSKEVIDREANRREDRARQEKE